MNKIKKRRKYKDNPYTLKFNEDLNMYQIIFMDSNNIKQIININIEVYYIFNEFELKDIKEMNEYDRHIEHLEQLDEFIYKRAINKHDSLENQVISDIMYDDLKEEINKLPLIQKRRLKKYFFEDMTLREIASLENCSIRAVKYSIDIALEKLKEKFKI